MDLRNVDFNLLLPLQALLEERSVTRAAGRMQMSQPALSATLSRLRKHFGDELLQRNGNSYDLTPLASHLLERLRSATRSVERVFSAQADFEPTKSTRQFTIFSSDYCVAMIGAALSTLMSEVTPGVGLRFLNMNSNVVDDAPDSVRDFDGVFIPHGYLKNQPYLDLFEDRWVCIVDAGNSLVGDTLQFTDLARLAWVGSFTGRSEFTPAWKQMELLGVQPRIEIAVAGFLPVPSVLSGTERIALVQERFARKIEATGQVRVLECPFDVVPFHEAFWWHPMYDRDPEHMWLRSMMTLAVERAGLEPALGRS